MARSSRYPVIAFAAAVVFVTVPAPAAEPMAPAEARERAVLALHRREKPMRWRTNGFPMIAALCVALGAAAPIPADGPAVSATSRQRGLEAINMGLDAVEAIRAPYTRLMYMAVLIENIRRHAPPAVIRRIETIARSAFATLRDDKGSWVAAYAHVLTLTGNDDEALGLVSDFPDKEERILERVAIARTQRGLVAPAMDLAGRLPDGERRSSVMLWIVWAQLRLGQIEAAQRTAEDITAGDDRDNARASFVEALANTGAMERAMGMYRRIATVEHRLGALLKLSKAWRKAGNPAAAADALAKAETVVASMTVIAGRRSLLRLVDAYWTLGRREDAHRLTDALGAWDNRPGTESVRRRDLATAQARTGDITSAMNTALAMREGYDSDDAFAEIAVALAVAGQLDKSLSLMASVRDVMARGGAKSRIARELLRAGRVDRAFATAGGIDVPETRFSAFIRLAKILLEPVPSTAATAR